MPGRDRFHWLLLLATLAALTAAVTLTYLGAPLSLALLVVMLAPWVSVVGYETEGHGHLDRVLERMRTEAGASTGGGSEHKRRHG